MIWIFEGVIFSGSGVKKDKKSLIQESKYILENQYVQENIYTKLGIHEMSFQYVLSSIGINYYDVEKIQKFVDWQAGHRYKFMYKYSNLLLYTEIDGITQSVNIGTKAKKD